MQVLPYLTFGVADNMHTLLNYFKPYLDFDKFDSEHSSEVTLYLDCFTAVASGIGVSCSVHGVWQYVYACETNRCTVLTMHCTQVCMLTRKCSVDYIHTYLAVARVSNFIDQYAHC